MPPCKLTLSDVLGLAALTRKAMTDKPWMYEATCTPGVRDHREEQMAAWIAEMLGDPDGTTAAFGVTASSDGLVSFEIPSGTYCTPRAARSLAARILRAADQAEAACGGTCG